MSGWLRERQPQDQLVYSFFNLSHDPSEKSVNFCGCFAVWRRFTGGQSGCEGVYMLDSLMHHDGAGSHTVTFDGSDGLVCEWVFDRGSIDNHIRRFVGDPGQLDAGPN